MFNQKRVTVNVNGPDFLVNKEGLIYSTGNITFDGSKYNDGDVIRGGTAVAKGANGYYAPVADVEEGTKLDKPMLVDKDHVYRGGDQFHVSAITHGNVFADLLTGTTEDFKEQSMFYFY